MKEYNHLKIEKKWQAEWEKKKTYQTKNNSKQKKFYVLDMFPYPSGAGLHVGHPRGYIGSDVYARMKRMNQYNVLHPMGYDAFGLPAEQYAIEHKINPEKAVAINIKTFEKQLSIMGLSYDWARRVNTTDPEYYKWTQWIFLQLFNSYYDIKKDKAQSIDSLIKIFEKSGNKNAPAYTAGRVETFSILEWKNFTPLERQNVLMNYRLAYEAETEVNWCQKLGTVLANDEIVNGKDGKMVSERGGYPVEKIKIKQWLMRITAYAERLLDGLEKLDWPNSIKEIQKNWIGKSQGLIFTAPVKDLDLKIQTFSAHFEACFADTFVVIAPDHHLLPVLLQGVKNKFEIEKKCKEILNKRKIEDDSVDLEPDGIFTGRYVVDPLGNGELPIWVANFAIASYGTGIVKCSCHDERDFRFAKKFNIPMKPVMFPKDPMLAEKIKNLEICFSDASTGILTEPEIFNGKNAHSIRGEIVDFLVSKSWAERKINYKMRDAIFARQRYWGEPIPLSRDKDGIIHQVKKLPLILPQVKSYEPTGLAEGPLAGVVSWVKAGYETNTMPGWAGSSWYFLRYMDPKNKKSLAGSKEIKYWKNVDMYVGGAEHATGHLLYSRFWHKFLKDINVTVTEEPFLAMRNQGMILAHDGRKMSKRWGNVINPDEMVKVYGADTLRLYEMFIGPFDQYAAWSTESIIGPRRFLERVWKLQNKIDPKTKSSKEFLNILHKTILKVTEDIEEMRFNTSVSALMILSSEMEKCEKINTEDFKKFLQILAPFAPHITEELWSILGEKKSIHISDWPKYDKKFTRQDEMKIVVLINGKVKTEIMIENDLEEDKVKEIVLANQTIKKLLNNQIPKRVIYVKNRLINIVI